MSGTLHPDPLGWLDELQDALTNPALEEFGQPQQRVSQAAELAAYQVAVALGYCRLFGVVVPDDLDGALTDRGFAATTSVFRRVLADWTDDARQLEARFSAAESLEDVNLCADMLHCCMEAWAVYLVLDEAYQETLEATGWRAEQVGVVDEVLDALGEFDAVLQDPENLALLSTVTAWPLLENWRQMLTVPYCEALPWWLDGTLEAVDRDVAQRVRAQIPVPDQLARSRKTAGEHSSMAQAGSQCEDSRHLFIVAESGPDERWLRRVVPDVETATVASDIAASNVRASSTGLQAVELQIKRFEQMSALKLAANAGGPQGADASSLSHAEWPVDGDSSIVVDWDWDPDAGDQYRLKIALVGKVGDVDRYRFVICRFQNGVSRRESLELGLAAICLPSSEATPLVALMLVDASGTHLPVRLS